MADVFISYASEDHIHAKNLADLLLASGWSVWWDRSILIGEAFDSAIERELAAAKSVVVLWSTFSVDSEWVKNEAAAAAERGVLLPAMIDKVEIPLEFRRRQTADMTNWRGDTADDGFQALCAGIASELGTTLPQTPARIAQARRPGRQLVIAVVVLVVVGCGVYLALPWRSTPTLPIGVDERSTTSAQEMNQKEKRFPVELADLATGNYHGDVVADSKGSSLSDVTVVITKLDRRTVRMTSDYERLGSVDITLTRSQSEGRDRIMSATGDSTLIIELNKEPVAISYNPHGELAYTGMKLQ